jgi:Fe-S cluster assembly iron-binding protein IscA
MTITKKEDSVIMLTITKRAATLLKAAKFAEGAAEQAGIRLRRGLTASESGRLAVGFAISPEPHPSDEQIEQEGLRIFVQDDLVEALDGRTLDIRDTGAEVELVFL